MRTVHTPEDASSLVAIVDLGRGPEVAGTRITVYRILDYVTRDYDPAEIAEELAISIEQVELALDYIGKHRHDIESKYNEILERVRRPNPARIDEGRAKNVDELRRRVMGRRAGGGAGG